MRNWWIIILLLITVSVSAQTSRTRELEKQRKAILAEIAETNALLTANKKSISNILNHINLVAQQINARQQLLEILSKEIQLLNEEIQLKETKIQELEKELQSKKENYVLSVQKMYKSKNIQNQLLFILSADDFAQSFRRVLYLREYSNWQKRQADEIVQQQEEIKVEKEILEVTKYEKQSLSSLKKNEENQLHKEETEKKEEMADLESNSKKLQTELNKKKKQAESLNKEIQRIIAEELEKARKAAKAQPKVARKAATKGGYAMTKEDEKLSSNFANNKGRLPFPLKGNYKITGRFGQQQFGDLKGVVYNNNGIEIETTPGNIAKAVFDGVVTRIFVVPGYHTSIIIRHGNYFTLYSYLETVSVKQGDKVATGQNIGKIYTDTENGNSTILHFEIWKESSKLNPEPWLNR